MEEQTQIENLKGASKVNSTLGKKNDLKAISSVID